MQNVSSLPVELQLAIIQVSDIPTCVNLLQTNHHFRSLTLYSLAQRLSGFGLRSKGDNEKDQQQHLERFLLSVYTPCHKISANEKFYFDIDTANNLQSLDDLSVTIKLNNIILSKNLFSEEVKDLATKAANNAEAADNNNAQVQQQQQQQLENLSNNIPLLVNEDATFFKTTFALLLKTCNFENPRVKVLEVNEKLRKSVLLSLKKRSFSTANCESEDNTISLSGSFYQIKYKLFKHGVEPPKFDYDYEVFENYTLAIESIRLNSCYLLNQIQSTQH